MKKLILFLMFLIVMSLLVYSYHYPEHGYFYATYINSSGIIESGGESLNITEKMDNATLVRVGNPRIALINNSNANFTNLLIKNPPIECPVNSFITYFNGTTSICVSGLLLAFLKNNSPANITALNVETLNGTALNLFNRSISLDLYNQSISLNDYIQALNLTTLDTLNLYIRIKDFNLNNISNYSQFIQNKDFNLGNITNDTIGLSKLNNNTIARLNQSVGQSGNLNITGNLTYIGSINATGLSGILNCNQLSGGTDTDFCTDTGGSINTNDLAIVNTTLFNNITIVRTVNLTTITRTADAFNLANATTNCAAITGGAGLCDGVDATGAGSGVSFTQMNWTSNFSHPTNVGYVIIPNLTLSLPATGSVFIECTLLGWALAATTGIQIEANVTGSAATNTRIMYTGSATAIALCGGQTNSTLCAATGSGAINSIIQLWTYSKRKGKGVSTIALRSELAGTAVNITTGSWCRYTSTNG